MDVYIAMLVFWGFKLDVYIAMLVCWGFQDGCVHSLNSTVSIRLASMMLSIVSLILGTHCNFQGSTLSLLDYTAWLPDRFYSLESLHH